MASFGRGEEEVEWEAGQQWSSFVSNSEVNLSGGSGAGVHEKKLEEPQQQEVDGGGDDEQENKFANKETAIVEGGARTKKRGRRGQEKNGGGGESDHEMHIWTERERRKKMRNRFSSLHSLLPHLPPKADKSTIVDEAVSYIKRLQQTLQGLQKQKLERLRGASLVSVANNQSPPVTTELSATTTTITREAFVADMIKNNNLNGSGTATAVSVGRLPLSFQTWTSPSAVLNVSGDDAFINVCTPKKPGLLMTVMFLLEKHKLEVQSAIVSSDCFRSMFMIHARAQRLTDQFSETLATRNAFKLAVGEILTWISSQFS